ncbi:hypothetical protein CECT5772_00691 [Streptococcus equi subsp. ruminatorum CECT 5772]|uniref:Uncharacterized protein n=1 Tax=Streptococcus equi subsp. ruminatorum CECT 5772 TaxID=1051981 RepID=A0A922T8V8_9STRE|nr:hypothetical protein CECT5772_00691 [Streptococcus equi subsp. ruminatorum CECT 5772]
MFTNEDCMQLMARYPDKHFNPDQTFDLLLASHSALSKVLDRGGD